MNNKILGLRTVIYRVNDVKEAADWYSKVFQTERYFNEPFYVGFNVAGYELGLVADEKSKKEKTGNVLTYWGVKDMEKEYERFLKSGATEYEKPHNVGGEIAVGAVKDPWGNVIGLIYNPNFKA